MDRQPTNSTSEEDETETASGSSRSGHDSVSLRVFVALLAGLMATNALATDIMLPAFPDIALELGTTVTAVQALITAYLFGFGLSQFFIGFVTDRYGRRPVLLIGLAIYTVLSFASAFAQELGVLLAIRFFQGMSAGAPRVIVGAAVRDCYEGRRMASVMSLVMTVFLAIPLVAPAVGQLILLVATWHWVLAALGVYGLMMLLLSYFLFPETLPEARRRAIRPELIRESLTMLFTSRQTVGYTLSSGIFFGALFGYIAQAQQLVGGIYGFGPWFPAVFAVMVGALSIATFFNARLVERFGMRVLSHGAIIAFTVAGLAMYLIALAGRLDFTAYAILQTLMMLFVGLVFANINALALEPHGRIAGVASAFISAFTIIIGATTGFFIGRGFDGTPVPLAQGYFICGALTVAMLLWTERGRLFVARNG